MVRDFCGHGLGRVFHALPNIVHYGRPGHGIVLKPGMFFTVEPMINLGGYGGEGVERRLDGGDARPFAFGAIRALRRRDRRMASKSSRSRPKAGTSRPTSEPSELADASRDVPHYSSAIASACASAFSTAARCACPTTNCWNCCCFAAIPRRDTKPLAKALIARFGSFAEVIAAPHERLMEVEGVERRRGHAAEDRRGRRASSCQDTSASAGRRSSPGTRLIDYCAAAMARSADRKNSASCSSTARTC